MVLRWGIVTAGKISHDFANAFNSYPDLKDQVITAVAARDVARAKAFALTHDIEHVFESYKALAESKEIDVAYIGALNPDHYNLAVLFLKNGKHVLCEKPLCMNHKQCESLIKLAKKQKLFLMEAVWSRFFPLYTALEKEIQDGKLGDVKFVEANFGLPIHTVDRVSKKELGGSTILDLGIYVLQFAQFIFKDDPIKVTATGELNKEGVDTLATIILEYSKGRRAVLNCHGKIRLWNKATVVGTKGLITVQDPFHCPTQMIHADGKIEKFPLHSSEIYYNFENSAGLVFEAVEVKRCIDQGLLESPRVSHKESLLLAKLEDTIRKQLGNHFDVDNQKFD